MGPNSERESSITVRGFAGCGIKNFELLLANVYK